MLEDDFDEIDHNLDGRLTRGELGQYLQDLGHYNPKYENEFQN